MRPVCLRRYFGTGKTHPGPASPSPLPPGRPFSPKVRQHAKKRPKSGRLAGSGVTDPPRRFTLVWGLVALQPRSCKAGGSGGVRRRGAGLCGAEAGFSVTETSPKHNWIRLWCRHGFEDRGLVSAVAVVVLGPNGPVPGRSGSTGRAAVKRLDLRLLVHAKLDRSLPVGACTGRQFCPHLLNETGGSADSLKVSVRFNWQPEGPPDSVEPSRNSCHNALASKRMLYRWRPAASTRASSSPPVRRPRR